MKTSKQVALLLGLTERRIQRWAKANDKPKFGRDYLLNDADVDRIRSRMGKRGRPKNNY